MHTLIHIVVYRNTNCPTQWTRPFIPLVCLSCAHTHPCLLLWVFFPTRILELVIPCHVTRSAAFRNTIVITQFTTGEIPTVYSILVSNLEEFNLTSENIRTTETRKQPCSS